MGLIRDVAGFAWLMLLHALWLQQQHPAQSEKPMAIQPRVWEVNYHR
jgi:hypothetical protein